MEHHQKTVQRLIQLTEIFDNPAVAIGAVIQLADVPIVSWPEVDQALVDGSASDGRTTQKRLAQADSGQVKRKSHG